jgi:EAL domain-containing protein (putative c-di-GMP-specific phosphodiesterase class I)/CheY-like chemotaxis protein
MNNEILKDKEDKNIVLIVDDQKINCAILSAILQKDYLVLEAHNGKEALDVLAENKVSAILLDLVMPIMDGFSFLDKIKGTPLASIPTIALTSEHDSKSEERALSLGAWDFVQKPYQPIILLTRLKNAIYRSRYYLLNEMKFVYEHDTLTGLLNRSYYFLSVSKLLEDNPLTKFIMVRADIKSFQTYNAFWGETEGDNLIKYIGSLLESQVKYSNLCVSARISADVFSITLPYDNEKLMGGIQYITEKLSSYKQDFIVVPVFGLYLIDNLKESPQTMFEFASLAAKNCKIMNHSNYLFYTPKMSEKINQDQWVVNEMKSAFDNGEFEFFLQPKFSLITNELIGSEALIRWRHHEKGLLSPGVFIPVLEKNGFISKVDFFVWDGVCKLLRKWLDEGKKAQPISVNLSRLDFYNPNLVNFLKSLIKKYNIPIELLELEVTESAYMENPKIMKGCVKELQDAGFKILMDDFGSGYSSLNTLKDINIDILKIDMKFLEDDLTSKRSKYILTCVVEMAKKLNTPVIIEGVETENQVEFLKSIGCVFAQGYYYSKPIEVKEFEKLMVK